MNVQGLSWICKGFFIEFQRISITIGLSFHFFCKGLQLDLKAFKHHWASFYNSKVLQRIPIDFQRVSIKDFNIESQRNYINCRRIVLFELHWNAIGYQRRPFQFYKIPIAFKNMFWYPRFPLARKVSMDPHWISRDCHWIP